MVRSPLSAARAAFDLNSGEWVRLFRLTASLHYILYMMEECTYRRPVTVQSAGSTTKEAVLKKMLPPNNKSIPEISKEEGICEGTLYNWRISARAEGRLLPDGDSTPSGCCAADKFAAVVETVSMNEAVLSCYCRERGLYAEQINEWREVCKQANDWDRTQTKRLQIRLLRLTSWTPHIATASEHPREKTKHYLTIGSSNIYP
jgi:hypothetical protein